MSGDTPKPKKSNSAVIRTELECMRCELNTLREDVDALEYPEVSAELKEVLSNLEHVQGSQTSIQGSLLAHHEEVNSQLQRLTEAVNRLTDHANASHYLALAQAGVQRFFVIIAGQIGVPASRLRDQTFLEQNREQKTMTSRLHKALKESDIPFQVWQDCCTLEAAASGSLGAGLETGDIMTVISSEECPPQAQQQKDSILRALEYVQSQGY